MNFTDHAKILQTTGFFFLKRLLDYAIFFEAHLISHYLSYLSLMHKPLYQ